MSQISILLVDDDEELCSLLERFLGAEGFSVTSVHNGFDGKKVALAGGHRLVILDRMLPGRDGMEILREIRAVSKIPVLMLTARGEDSDRIRGLELGADDYLPKPFNPGELVARIRAILRRTPEGSGSAVIRVGDLEVNSRTRTVTQDGRNIELTSAEFDILAVLVESAGKPVSRDELATKALGRKVAFLDRSVDMHISNLRRKLGASQGGHERIKSLRGTGYIYTGSTQP